MPNVVRFALSEARDQYVSGVGFFRDGILDVDANRLQLVSKARYLVQPYRAVEIGTVDAGTPKPNLPAPQVPPAPNTDPFPQYLTPAEVISSPSIRNEFVLKADIDEASEINYGRYDFSPGSDWDGTNKRIWTRLASVDAGQPGFGAAMTFLLSGTSGWGDSTKGTVLVAFGERDDESPQIKVWGWDVDPAEFQLYTKRTGVRSSELWARLSVYNNDMTGLVLNASTVPGSTGHAKFLGDSFTEDTPADLSSVVPIANMSAPGTPDNYANETVRRNDAGMVWLGRAYLGDMGDTADAAPRKDYVDEATRPIREATPEPQFSQIVKRDDEGHFHTQHITLEGQPQPWSATRRDYVDGKFAPRVVADWNDATETGWYTAENAANSPAPGTPMAVQVFAIGYANAVQVATGVVGGSDTSPADTRTWRRVLAESSPGTNTRVWGPWHRLRISEAEQGPITSVSAAPPRLGQFAVAGGVGYMATGTASAADWKVITA